MTYDYSLSSPSLEGIITHDYIKYEGINRPTEIMRFFDGPATKSKSYKRSDMLNDSEKDYKILNSYFSDLYGLFMKKLSNFVIESEIDTKESLCLQAMLQEMVKVKKMLCSKASYEMD